MPRRDTPSTHIPTLRINEPHVASRRAHAHRPYINFLIKFISDGKVTRAAASFYTINYWNTWTPSNFIPAYQEFQSASISIPTYAALCWLRRATMLGRDATGTFAGIVIRWPPVRRLKYCGNKILQWDADPCAIVHAERAIRCSPLIFPYQQHKPLIVSRSSSCP